MSGPTHEHGHTLDLVLCHGLSVSNTEICDNVFSDHLPSLFEVDFSCAAVKSGAPACSPGPMRELAQLDSSAAKLNAGGRRTSCRFLTKS